MNIEEAADLLGSNIEPEKPKSVGRPKMKVSNGETNRVTIVLEDNEAIPPTGLFISHNGRTFLMKTGEEVNIPEYVLEILDHAVMSTPIVDQDSGQVIGYRDRMRYPYRLIRSPPGR